MKAITSKKYHGVRWRQTSKGKSYYIRIEGKEKSVGTEATGMTMEKAFRILCELRTSKDRIVHLKSSTDETVDDLWLAFANKPAKRGTLLNHQRPSWYDDELRYHKHIEPVIGHKIASTITSLDAVHTAALRKRLSPQSIKHILGLAVRVLKSGGVKVDPPSVACDNQRVDVLPNDIYQAFKGYLYAEGSTSAWMLLFVMATGLRRNNVVMAKRSDIDEAGFLHLAAEDTKSGRSEKIFLNRMAREILEAQGNGGVYLFPAPDGGYMQPYTATRHFNRLIKKSGLPFPADWRPTHSFRHVYATRLLSTGKVGLADVQGALCHKTPAMTSRYAHFVDEARVRIATVSDEAL